MLAIPAAVSSIFLVWKWQAWFEFFHNANSSHSTRVGLKLSLGGTFYQFLLEEFYEYFDDVIHAVGRHVRCGQEILLCDCARPHSFSVLQITDRYNQTINYLLQKEDGIVIVPSLSQPS